MFSDRDGMFLYIEKEAGAAEDADCVHHLGACGSETSRVVILIKTAYR